MTPMETIELVLEKNCEGYEHGTSDAILTALRDAGFVVVPVEPTTKMLMDKKAGACWPTSPSGFYRAMVQASTEEQQG